MNKLADLYGNGVSTGKVLVRRTDVHDGYSVKVWSREDRIITGGIFLGFRTLSNGSKYFDSEYGWIYTPKKHFRAALVSPGPNRSPVYVMPKDLEFLYTDSVVRKALGDING